MTYMQNHILASSGWSKKFSADGSGGLALIQPPNNHPQPRATSVVFTGRVESVSGSPTSWAWDLYLETLSPQSSDYQNTRPEWVPVSPEDIGVQAVGAVIGSNGAIRVADENTALPLGFVITVPNMGPYIGVRVRTDIPYSGSAVPAIQTSLNMIERGD